jgi:AAA15 family ATPase/GTPase
MLDSISIKNFKAIKDPGLTLTGLANVNYLVGKNGCGKSSVLEGIQILEPYLLFEKNSKFRNIDFKYYTSFSNESKTEIIFNYDKTKKLLVSIELI